MFHAKETQVSYLSSTYNYYNLSHSRSSENGEVASDIEEFHNLNNEITLDNDNFIVVNNNGGIIEDDTIDSIDIQSK